MNQRVYSLDARAHEVSRFRLRIENEYRAHDIEERAHRTQRVVT
jgi:hypothetical protein